MEPETQEDQPLENIFFLTGSNLIPPFFQRFFHYEMNTLELRPPHKRPACKSSAGYSLDLFLSPPPVEFRCQICGGVAKKPLECRKCGSLFCSSCISVNILSNSSSMSLCSVCNTTIVPKNSSPLLIRMISELKIRCVNSKLGCSSTFNLGDFAKHENSCPHKKVLCKNYEHCKQIGLLKDYIESEVISRNRTRIRVLGSRVYTCSEYCHKVVGFRDLVYDKQNEVALTKYFELLKETNS